ncbi:MULTISPECIES: hypothetical protein [unclassified Pseudoclavibacter]|uniref:hypothetical protein n=1 Tax=unclassified Pseudoclavibacter TaxID=2615177 RepID=UPI001BAAEDF9|nr:hypothetical protein [Pseudoclavibacter sp. Marseille-Q4354]MBS3180030.1 hypothetical protein [Pseudoclavibacter sp. Marseille-Q4354]
MHARFIRAAAVATLSITALTGCVASPFSDVFADEPAAPAAPAAPAGPSQNDAPGEPSGSAAQVTALDLTAVVRQANEILSPVLSECVTGVQESAPRTSTSDPRVTCAGQLGPLASDLSGGMRGRDVTVDATTVGAFPGVQLLQDRSAYATMTTGRTATVPLTSTGAWEVSQSATGTTDASTASGFDVVDQIEAEITLAADVSVDAAGAVTAIVVTGTTSVSSTPKAVF